MKMNELIKEEFPNWPEGKRNQIDICSVGNNITVAMFNYGRKTYIGKAYCDERDTWNRETGIRIALQDLHRLIEHARRAREKKTWIPKKDTYYFTVVGLMQENDDREFIPVPDIHIVRWYGSPLDYYRLGAGLVFKSERAARKYARSTEIKGRRYKNLLRRMP